MILFKKKPKHTVCMYISVYLFKRISQVMVGCPAKLQYYTAKYGHKGLFLARKTTYLTLRHFDTCTVHSTATDNFATVDSRLYEQYVNFT